MRMFEGTFLLDKHVIVEVYKYRINPPIRRGFFKKKAHKNPDPSYNQGLWPYRYFQQSPAVARGHGKCRSSKPVEGYIVYPSSLDRNSSKVIL